MAAPKLSGPGAPADIQEREPSPFERMESMIRARANEITALLPGTYGTAAERKEAVGRFCRQLLTACDRNPQLMDPEKCSPDSFWLAGLNIAAVGLDPSGASGEAAIVPFKGKAMAMIMVRGYIVLAIRSGAARSIDHAVVCEGDLFDYELGSSSFIRHKPSLGQRGRPLAVWAIATLPSGDKVYEVMGWSDIEAIKKRSRSADNGPWQTDPLEMGRKTIVRRISKRLPWNASADMVGAMLQVEQREDAVLFEAHAVRGEIAQSEQPAQLGHSATVPATGATGMDRLRAKVGLTENADPAGAQTVDAVLDGGPQCPRCKRAVPADLAAEVAAAGCCPHCEKR